MACAYWQYGQIDKPSKNAQMLFLRRTHQVPEKNNNKQTDKLARDFVCVCVHASVCVCVCVHMFMLHCGDQMDLYYIVGTQTKWLRMVNDLYMKV